MNSTAVEDLLQTRIEEGRDARRDTKTALDALSGKITSAIAQIGKKGRETMEQLEEQYVALERSHSTTTQTNQDERKFMRDMQDIRTKKKELAAYEVKQSDLTALKDKRNTLSDSLRHTESMLDELYASQRRLRAASKVGCDVSELSEKKITIPEVSRPHVIGKGGSSIRQIEGQAAVSIDIERNGGGILLTGSPAGIAVAEELIQVIVDTQSVELVLSPAALSVLMYNKAERAQAIQTEHGVRLDISRANKSCKITGLSANLSAATAVLEGMDCRSERVQLDASVIPVLIGKAGANIQKIQADLGVQIDLDREDMSIVVNGMRDCVAKAVTFLKAFVDDSKEIEVSMVIDRSVMAMSIMGTGGKHIRALQEQYPGVYLQIAKPENVAAPTPVPGAGAEKENRVRERPSAEQTFIIKGRAGSVLHAKARVEDMIRNHHACTEVVQITQDCRMAMLTKQGACIKAMREAFPLANIEVLETDALVVVHSVDPVVRQAAKAAVMGVAALNLSKDVDVSKDVTISLKSARGAATRERMVAAGLTFSIDTEGETVLLRGAMDAILKGEELLADLASSAAVMEMELSDEDLGALSEGGDSSFLRTTGAAMDVEMQPMRKANLLRIRGSSDKIVEAEAAVMSFLNGDGDGSIVFFSISDKAIGGFVGKAGANVKMLEQNGKEGKVKIDILRSMNKVRIRAQDPAAAEACKHAALKIMDGVKTRATLDIAVDADLVGQVGDIFCVDAFKERDGKKGVVLNGAENAVTAAVAYLREQGSGEANMLVPVPEQQLARLRSDESLLQSVQQGCAEELGIDVGLSDGGIRITGPSKHAELVKMNTYRMLDMNFPNEFAIVPMDRTCLSECDLPSQRALIIDAVHTGEIILHSDALLSCMRVMGPASGVITAVDKLREIRSEWITRHARVSIERYMVPVIVGNKGSGIDALQKVASARLKIDRTAGNVVIMANSSDELTQAKAAVEARVAEIASTHFTLTLDSDEQCQRLIGKAGATIKKIRAESGATLNLEAKTRILTVNAPDAKSLVVARTAVLEVIELFLASNHVETRCIEGDAIPQLIGKSGTSIREVQTAHNVRVDIDRTPFPPQLVIKGSVNGCSDAIETIDKLLLEGGYPPLSVVTMTAPKKAAPAEEATSADAGSNVAKNAISTAAYVPIGATSTIKKETDYSNMSASAARRARRKERDAAKKIVEGGTLADLEVRMGRTRAMSDAASNDSNDGSDPDRSFEMADAAEFDAASNINKGFVGVIGSPTAAKGAAAKKPDASLMTMLMSDLSQAEDPVHTTAGPTETQQPVADDAEGYFVSKRGLRIRL